MEVADGIHRIDTTLGPRISSTYVVVGTRAAVLFDVGVDGTPHQVIGPYLDGVGLPRSLVSFTVISHCDVDHFGGLADARATFPGSRVLSHEADRAAITDYPTYLRQRAREFLQPWGFDEHAEVLAWTREVTREGPVDLGVRGGEMIDLGDRPVQILHVAGHTRGHLALHDLSTGALLVSDAVLGAAVRNADGTGAFPPTYRYVDDYLSTIERLRSLRAPLLLTAHYPTVSGDGVSGFLDESASFAARLDDRVKEAVSRHPDGVGLHELLEELNDGSEDWPVHGTSTALAFPVVGHLERFIAAGTMTLVRAADSDRALIRTHR